LTGTRSTGTSVILRHRALALALCGWLAHGIPSPAVAAENADDCAADPNDRKRLACYDRTHERPARPRGSILDQLWPSVDDEDRERLTLMGHNTNYLLPLRLTDGPNERPTSPTQGTANAGSLEAAETKFQISIKTPVRRRLLDGRLELWVAYTQQSHWQVLLDSGPFRETNYEPEAMALIRVDQKLPGLDLRYVNIGLVHQSNGRGAAISRSWNRVYAQFGFERGDDFALLVRPWIRLPELERIDSNPDIQRYIGRMEVTAMKRWQSISLALTLRSNLSLQGGRGSAQFDIYFPLYRQLKGYVQVFSGFGESLIDYNHRQTTIGLGVALVEWL
jgi:phospholipase A1/A2